jgi:hypothetical protein
METSTSPQYRYRLRVEIPATEVAVLVDGLDGGDFSLRERMGRDELRRQLENQVIDVDVLSETSWPEFERDIETLSRYLSEPIHGREIHVEPGPTEPLREGWVVLGWRGETARVALDLGWGQDAMAVVDRGIDEAAARRRWDELPGWVRSSITHRQAALGVR